MSFPFNVRAYGVWIHGGRLLVTKEEHQGRSLTKLPGGGLEFGEGLAAAVVREFREETGLEMRVVEHLYTTDFFQVSAFDPHHQIISVYYVVEPVDPSRNASHEPFQVGNQRFFWLPVETLEADDFTLPIDRYVVPLIRAKAGRP